MLCVQTNVFVYVNVWCVPQVSGRVHIYERMCLCMCGVHICELVHIHMCVCL
jgi:hypothetical protein